MARAFSQRSLVGAQNRFLSTIRRTLRPRETSPDVHTSGTVHRPSGFRHTSPLLAALALAVGCGGLGTREDVSQSDSGRGDSSSSAPDTRNPVADAFLGRNDGGIPPIDADGTGTGSDPDVAPGNGDGGAGAEVAAPPPSTIIVLPDTQYYTFAPYTDVFAMQTNWIIAQKASLNIQAVLHVGDLVEVATDSNQWHVAGTAMHSLDGIAPYVVVPGNHDCDTNRTGLIDAYFGPATMPWITGTMVAGQMENNYALVDIGGQQWLVVAVEFGPRDAVVAWADTVFKAYPDRPAILLTHGYLYSDGTRYNLAVAGTDSRATSYQYWYPQYYEVTPMQGINDGEMLWQKLVLPNPNVRMVFSGHETAAIGGARLSSSRPDGSVVHQMLSDYQWLWGPHFGYGFLRIVQINYSKKTIQVSTYSPYLDQYLTDDSNQFTLDWNL
jgi:predicted phosphodiesterase